MITRNISLDFNGASAAIDDGAIAWLEAGQTRTWSINVELHS